MRHRLPGIALALSALLLAASLGSLPVAVRSRNDASAALDGAIRLRQARLDVAEAQKQLQGGNIKDALVSARAANATALRVGRVTRRILELLRPTATDARAVISSARRGAQRALAARQQTDVAADALVAVANYQHQASRHSGTTNRALRRILRALRETNREFEP